MNKESVLIVDDDLGIRTLISDMVQSFGYNCVTADSGMNALDLIRWQNFDTIIADIHMPEISGLDLIREVHKTATDIPFICITGHSSKYSYDTVVKAGAQDFITKPFTVTELKNKLDRIFMERRIALENRLLLDEQKTTGNRLSSLLEAARDLTAELDMECLFPLIIGRITKAMGAERTSLYLIDWASNIIWTKVAEKVDQIRLPIGEGISGRVAQTGEIINVDDAWNFPGFYREFDIKHKFRTCSVLCMPISSRAGERIAVIEVLNKKGGQGFGQEDENLLRSLASQVAIALENSQLMDELRLSFESSILTLSATVDAKHPLTAGHSQRVTEYSLMIAREMGLGEKELAVIKYAGLLHDIGKIGIRDEVLYKYGPFTAEERAEMAMHTVKTRAILEKFRFPKALCDVPTIAAHHHEKVNGQGYPDGLKGTEIPLGSRIMAVADVFDAITSARDYPKYTHDEVLNCEPMPLDKAIAILEHDAGTHFDPDAVSALLTCLPRILLKYRNTNFAAEYVDETIRSLAPELLKF